MRKTLFLSGSCFLIGVVTTVVVFERYLVPLRMKRTDDFYLGEMNMKNQIIENIEKEFGLTETANPTDIVVISSDRKVVIVKEKNGLKTLKVHETKIH